MRRLFRYDIQADTVKFKYARGASDRTGKEFHVYHEIILFLDGEGELISESVHTRLKPDTLIVIPKETYHQVIIHGDQEDYHRYVLNFDDTQELLPLLQRSMSQLRVSPADGLLRHLFGKLTDLAQEEDPAAKTVLKAVLTVLLSELCTKDSLPSLGDLQSGLVRDTVRYIDENLHEKITVQDVARACNVSESSLAHTFKKEMNMPLHRYILKKRLITAYHKIRSGVPATVAADRCGFRDYSGFYKQYKKMFGFSPSSTEKSENNIIS